MIIDSNSLLTLLVSNQFVELKGSVFKKFEKENLFQIACAGTFGIRDDQVDMVERFQIFVFLLFVMLQNCSDMNWQISDYWVFLTLSLFAILIGSLARTH